MNKEMIEKLRHNMAMFRAMSIDERRCLQEVKRINCQYLNVDGVWEKCCGVYDNSFTSIDRYRISPSYNPCPDAQWIQGKYEVVEIVVDDNKRLRITWPNTSFAYVHSLVDDPDFVGFVFEEWPKKIHRTSLLYHDRSGHEGYFADGADDQPVTAKWAVFKK
jgi:hypothetical protein